jgi:hypothetical protein
MQARAESVPEEALLLDFLHHATAAGHARLPQTKHALGALCSLAQRSVCAFSVIGLPDLALESLSLNEAWVAAADTGEQPRIAPFVIFKKAWLLSCSGQSPYTNFTFRV